MARAQLEQVSLTVVCSWCGERFALGLNDQLRLWEDSDRVSHGICPDCNAKVTREAGLD